MKIPRSKHNKLFIFIWFYSSSVPNVPKSSSENLKVEDRIELFMEKIEPHAVVLSED